MTFAQPNYGQLYYILNQTPIVPEHIWATVSNPVHYLDTDPMRTRHTYSSLSPLRT